MAKKTVEGEHGTPKTNFTKKETSKNHDDFKKIIGHKVVEEHYVEYEVELTSGKTITATEFDFKGDDSLLSTYKKKVTKQSDDSSGEYAVERVLAHRKVKGSPLYLVQWKGYPHPVWNSEMWEEDLDNCKDLLAAYKKHQEDLKIAQTPKKTPSKTPKKTPKSLKRRALTPSDDEEEAGPIAPEPKKTPKQSTKKLKRTTSPETNLVEKSKKKAIPDLENHTLDQEKNDVIERVEEIQEDEDDDDEQREEVVTTAPVETKSRWGFGSWKWF